MAIKTFRGLFIGIDRFVSPSIRDLSCAARDATALHALFKDNLKGEFLLLTDQEANLAAVEASLNALTNCSRNETVFIAFSCHGTKDRQLTVHDTDFDDLERTTLSLSSLDDYFERIPAKRVICILDCCFAGGPNAKTLYFGRAQASPSFDDTVDLSHILMTDNRLILAASAKDQPAYENVRAGHGLLTHFLLEALMGPEEIVEGKEVAFSKLLEHVQSRAKDAAAPFKKRQTPTVLGSLNEDFILGVFKPGKNYKSAFPKRHVKPVESELRTLAPYGFPAKLISALPVPSLNQLQLDAINNYGLLKGEHLVVSAPTSSGKTLIGELSAVQNAVQRKRAVFLMPLKALVADKLAAFKQSYQSYGLRIIEATGETADVTPLINGKYDIALLTFEKFASLLLGNPQILEQIGVIVVDEVQMIADSSRGVNLEFVLTQIRMKRREGIEPQLVLLSAGIGDTNGLEAWLAARLLDRDERPIPLDEGVILKNGTFKFLDGETREQKIEADFIQPTYETGKNRDWIVPLVRKLVQDDKQVIVFRETKGEAFFGAKYTGEALRLAPAETVLADLPANDPTRANQNLRETLGMGVAFHISDLSPEERTVVESQFRKPDSEIRVIFATTTLAMGVNTPTDAVIIKGLQHPVGGGKHKPYSVAEYKNMVGRAGRLGHTQHNKGESFLLALSDHDEELHWNSYVNGTPENLESHFLSRSTDLRSLIIKVLAASRKSMKSEEISAFLEASFGVYQMQAQTPGWRWDPFAIQTGLKDLEARGLIKSVDDKMRLTSLGRAVGESGIEVNSAIKVVECLQPLTLADISDPVLIATAQVTDELDDMLFPINKRGYRKEEASWFGELQNQQIPHAVLRKLQMSETGHHMPALRAKKAVACLLFVTETSMVDIEQIVVRHGGGGFLGSAGAVRQITSRTCDVLPAVARIAEVLHPQLDLVERLNRLLVRLEIGLPSDAANLALNAGAQLTRGDYFALIQMDIINVDHLETADDATVLQALNGDQGKLNVVREAVTKAKTLETPKVFKRPILAPYEP